MQKFSKQPIAHKPRLFLARRSTRQPIASHYMRS